LGIVIERSIQGVGYMEVLSTGPFRNNSKGSKVKTSGFTHFVVILLSMRRNI
jgi:hypothetical protein